MRLNKQNQSTLAVFIWFAFLNTHLVLLVLALIYWRINHPGVPFGQMAIWDPAIANDTVGFVGLTLATALAGIGLGLGLKFFSEVRQVPNDTPVMAPTKLVLSYAMLDGVGVIGLGLGVLKGNILLGIPFVVTAAICIAVLFPSGDRFPKAEVKHGRS